MTTKCKCDRCSLAVEIEGDSVPAGWFKGGGAIHHKAGGSGGLALTFLDMVLCPKCLAELQQFMKSF